MPVRRTAIPSRPGQAEEVGRWSLLRTREMSETATLESIGRRLDGLQNNVSGLNRRMITLESNLIDRVGALEAKMAELEDRTDQLVARIGALATSLNSLILLVERIAKAQGLPVEMILRSPLD
jgi:hypothetical protein